MKELLDQPIEDHDINNWRPRSYFIFSVISYFLSLAFIISLRNYLPKNIIEYQGANINTLGLLTFILLIIYPNILTTSLHKKNANLSRPYIILFVGLSILVAEVSFRIIQQLYFTYYSEAGELYFFNYLLAFVFPMIIAIIGALFSFSKIQKLTGNNVVIARLATILFFVVLYFFSTLLMQ